MNKFKIISLILGLSIIVGGFGMYRIEEGIKSRENATNSEILEETILRNK